MLIFSKFEVKDSGWTEGSIIILLVLVKFNRIRNCNTYCLTINKNLTFEIPNAVILLTLNQFTRIVL
jgi:hypothetical protein